MFCSNAKDTSVYKSILLNLNYLISKHNSRKFPDFIDHQTKNEEQFNISLDNLISDNKIIVKMIFSKCRYSDMTS